MCNYASLLMTDDNKRFSFEYPESIDLIGRAAEYFWCIHMPKELSDMIRRCVGGDTES